MNKSEIEFGSFLSYSVRGTSNKAEESKSTMRNLKRDRVLNSGILTSENFARAIKNDLNKYPFEDYFNSDAVLVPTPRSSLPIKGMLWVPQRITTALINNGLGKSSEACLERIVAVSRSSGQRNGALRATPSQHYESMKVNELLFEPKEIVMVDDVVTRGSTFLGGVNRLAEAFPKAKIRAFAVMRSIYAPNDFSEIVDPCVGKITVSLDVPQRDP